MALAMTVRSSDAFVAKPLLAPDRNRLNRRCLGELLASFGTSRREFNSYVAGDAAARMKSLPLFDPKLERMQIGRVGFLSFGFGFALWKTLMMR